MQSVKCGKVCDVNFDAKVVTFRIENEGRSSWYSISYKVFLEEGMYEGMLIKENELDNLIHLEDKNEVLELAYSALKFKDLSKKELKDKLLKRNYVDDLVEEVINELEQKGYINDQNYIDNYIEEAINKRYGLKKIEYELMNKGLNEELVYERLSQISSDDEYERALDIAKKYYKTRQNAKNIKSKMQQYLYNLGYDVSYIHRVIATIFNDINDYY